MIFNSKKNTNSFSSFLGWILLGVFGVFYGVNNLPENIPQLNPVGSTTSSVDVVLANKSVAEKEKLYKLIVGVSDFLKNSERVRKNIELKDLLTEVVLTYKLEDNNDFQPLITEAVNSAGLNEDKSILEIKEKAIDVFGKLANDIKTNIEKTQTPK